MERAAERKAKGKKSGGGGKPVMDAKAAAIAQAIESGIEPKNLPAELKWTAQLGIPHLKDSPERRQTYLHHLSRLGHAEGAARATDGIEQTGRFFRALALKDSAFAADVRDALNIYGAALHKTAHLIAVEGVLEPLVSQGQVVGHKRVWAEKTLQMLLRKHDTELRNANQGGSGATVNINIGKTGMEVGADGEAIAFIKLSETYYLPDADREHLLRIYSSILARREQMKEVPALDWTPPQELKELIDLEATEIEDDYDDI
ncbi:hypothetical protein [Aestuariivirga sp.]|uniref:hypothetical protein n=1 Tax=Aestuariivirga sp. TaxID=2650926 RepID=UPI0035936411